MPIYEYECEGCGRVEEAFQKISDKPLRRCGHCSGKLHKLISQSAFHLKGTGWYVTDYTNKGKAKKDTGTSKTDGGEKAPAAASAKTETSSPPAASSG